MKSPKQKQIRLYNHLLDVDANYGTQFTQQHHAFKASLAKAMNQKFRELDINALIRNLKESESKYKIKTSKFDWY